MCKLCTTGGPILLDWSTSRALGGGVGRQGIASCCPASWERLRAVLVYSTVCVSRWRHRELPISEHDRTVITTHWSSRGTMVAFASSGRRPENRFNSRASPLLYELPPGGDYPAGRYLNAHRILWSPVDVDALQDVELVESFPIAECDSGSCHPRDENEARHAESARVRTSSALGVLPGSNSPRELLNSRGTRI